MSFLPFLSSGKLCDVLHPVNVVADVRKTRDRFVFVEIAVAIEIAIAAIMSIPPSGLQSRRL